MLRSTLALTLAALAAACTSPQANDTESDVTANVAAFKAPKAAQDGQDGRSADARRFLWQNPGGLSHMFLHDPERLSLSLITGEPGGILENYGSFNRDSHIRYYSLEGQDFQVGVQGGQDGAILDLGSVEDMMAAYDYRETVGGGTGYASLRWDEGELWITGPEGDPDALQRVDGQEQLYNEERDADRAEIQLGHVYVVRIWDRREPDFQIVSKFKVVDHVPGVRTSLRWELIDLAPRP